MSTKPADHAPRPPPVAATEWVSGSFSEQRRLLRAATVGIIVLILTALSAFMWREHQLALDKAGERSKRLSLRIAQNLEQTLTVARMVISQVEAQLQPAPATLTKPVELPGPDSYSSVLASLPLPFRLHAIDDQGASIAIVGKLDHSPTDLHEQHVHAHSDLLAPERWQLSAEESFTAKSVIPLGWKAQANSDGVKGFGVDLSRFALDNWLERDRIEPDDQVSLFWLNDDGTTTLLISAPSRYADIGQKVRAPWTDAAIRAGAGQIDQTSVLDGMSHRVAFQRLDGAANAMVVVYSAGTQMALAKWRAEMPFFLGLALFLATAMAYGAWRLDLSLRALTQSERHFQLMLDSGNVWDWDIAKKTVRYSPNFFSSLGLESVPTERMGATLFKAIHPDDIAHLRTALVLHLKERKPYAPTFRIRDGRGEIRWFESNGQAFWDNHGRAQYMAGTTFEVTERIALEEAQRQTLQRLDIVANASPVLFCTSDLHGEVNWLNRRWLAFTGRSAEQERGQGWLAGVHPEDLPRRQAFFGSVRTRQEAVSTEFRLRDKNGTYRWMVVQCLPLTSADRGVTGFIVSCVDISELKQAEAAAKERGAMLEAVFDVLQDLLFVIDQDGRFVHFQGASDDRLDERPDNYLGKPVREVMPEPIAELIHDQLKLAESGQLREFDYRLSIAGSEHHFDARMARLPGSGHYMVMARDITERDLLRNQQERQRHFMTLQARLSTNFINLPIHQIDQGIEDALAQVGKFAHTDRAYIFEYNFANHQTSNTHEWCAPNVPHELGRLQNIDLDLIPDWVEAHKQGKQIYIPDVSNMASSTLRQTLYQQGIRSLITLPMNANDGCIGFVGFDSVHANRKYSEEQIGLLRQFAQMLVNVYSRRSADARLQRLTSELEERVQERTHQLAVSVRRLSLANQELESFAYSVSHDLKAPLRSVEGFASLLLNDHSEKMDAEGQDYLKRIQQAALHMARLISDLLAYCRIEELDKQIKPVSLLEVVNGVLKGMRNELDAQGVKIHLKVPADLTALAHPQGLAMVLRNLIDNAIKFTLPGDTPDITLTASTEGQLTRLCIKDQGQGFDMRHHDRIFAIFQRLHRPEAIAGTGIGLAMVQKAVQRMNGRIWANSEVGKGAKFHIELPRA